MKKYLFGMALCLVGFATMSCNDPTPTGDDEDPFVYKARWERDIDEIVASGALGDDLVMTGYKYLKKIESQEEAKELFNEILGPDNLVPAYRGSFTEFELETWQHIKDDRCDNIKPAWYEAQVDSILSTLPKIGTISWQYRSKSFSTVCVIDNNTNGLFYDNICSHIVIVLSSGHVQREVAKTKSSVEEPSNPLRCDVKYGDSIHIGNKQVKAWVAFGIIGKNDGTQDIQNSYTNDGISNFPGSGSTTMAAIREAAYTPGVSGQQVVTFAYGIAPEGHGMFIDEDHSGNFTISNQQYGRAGREVLRPSDLK